VSAYFACASLRKGAPVRWLWKKIARLLPAYLIAVLITYVVMRFAAVLFSGQHLRGGPAGFMFGLPTGPPTTAAPWYLPTGVDLFANLTMIQGWSPSFNGSTGPTGRCRFSSWRSPRPLSSGPGGGVSTHWSSC
jgi:peptidoglycan/LPS O-acetylase OafA/YrhL